MIITQFDDITNKNVQEWLDGPFDAETKNAIKEMIIHNPKEVIDSFYTNLSFGTGGMRGLMGIGSNRLNFYTIRACTQGLANYINLVEQEKEKSVLIGYDSRKHSKEFAIESAKVLAANNIKVYIYKDLRPTPMVSFGCRFKKATSAIMITASHNPPQYNGYKVYWNDGGQVLPPNDQGIVDEVNKINSPALVKSVDSDEHLLIHWIDEEIDEAYLAQSKDLQLYANDNKTSGDHVKIVYTSLFGTGITMVPKAMNTWGFTNLHYVEKQVIPDGDFPGCNFPNPEEKEALSEGIKVLLKENADVLIATDPDCDRVGTAVLHKGEIKLIDGNQMACLLLHHILSAKKWPENGATVKTIVTSELFTEICSSFGYKTYNVLTGFKYIAEQIRKWEHNQDSHTYIFGGEESYGYLYGTNVRDKDAIICSILIAEMALQAKLKGLTLIDCLEEIWKEYGYFVEKTFALKFEESKAGKDQMENIMLHLQQNPPTSFAGVNVLSLEDYQAGIKKDFTSGKVEKILLPKSEVLLFRLQDGTKLIIRPSGTEPKIKIYCGVKIKETGISVTDALSKGEQKAKEYISKLQELTKKL